MAPWRVAKSLDKLRAQINSAWPNRSKASDGTIGDAAHAATKSEHNPEDHDHDPSTPGVVRAMDITHDPANGCDAQRIVDLLVASRDNRILYIIFNGRMWRSYAKPNILPWVPAPYTGSNPHRHHFHISVVADAALFDSDRTWRIPATVAPFPRPKPEPTPADTLAPGAAMAGGAVAVGAAVSGNGALLWLGAAVLVIGLVAFLVIRARKGRT